MAFLSADAIRDLCKNDPPLIKTTRTTNFLEGSAYDVQLKSILVPAVGSEKPFIGKDARRLPKMLEIAHEPVGGLGDEIYSIGPGSYILKSEEHFFMPDNIGGIILPRTSFFDAQCVFSGTRIAPGFSGYLRNLLVVSASRGIYLEKGARYCCVMFYTYTLGKTDPYEGMRVGDISPTNDEFVRAF